MPDQRLSPSRSSEPARQHILITGGAGYIGSLLTGILLQQGCQVTVVDDLLFGGESLLGYFSHPNFRFLKGDVCDPVALERVKVEVQGTLEEILHGPAHDASGSVNLTGALRRALALCGFETLKDLQQKAELVVDPR